MMNLLANKSINLNIPYLALDCGIIFSWVTFLLMDIVVKRFGLKAANLMTIIGLLVNLFFAIILALASIIPGTWSQSYVTGSEDVINNALDLTIRNTWYILAGSSIAYTISSLINNILNHFIGKKVDKDNKFKGFAIRTYLSTFIAQFIDNIAFAFLVSYYFFDWTIVQCVMCALTGATLELLLEVLFSPLAYKICKRWEKDNVGKEYLDYINKEKGEKNESIN